MSINITPVKASGDPLDFFIQDIEKYNDFLNLTEIKTDSFQDKLESLSELENQILKEESTSFKEKEFLAEGKDLPIKLIKNFKDKDDLENNDSAINIYNQFNTFFNQVNSFPISNESKLDVTLQQLSSYKNSNLSNEMESAEAQNSNESEQTLSSLSNFTKLTKLELNNEDSEHNKNFPISEKTLTLSKNIKAEEVQKKNFDDSNYSENLTDLKNQTLGINGLLNIESIQETKLKVKDHSAFSSTDNTIEISEFNISDINLKPSEIPDPEILDTIEYHSNATSNFEKELGEHLVSMIKESNHHVTLKLDPPELGKMDISVDLFDDIANLSFYTNDLQVKSAIEASLIELRNMFSQQELFLGEVQVFHQASDNQQRKGKEYNELTEKKQQNTSDNLTKRNNSSDLSSGNISVFV